MKIRIKKQKPMVLSSSNTMSATDIYRAMKLFKSPKPDFVCSYELPAYKFSKVCKHVKGDVCRTCGWSDATCDAHHIVPRSKGGKNTLCNCEILCPNCHRILHERARKKESLDQWSTTED